MSDYPPPPPPGGYTTPPPPPGGGYGYGGPAYGGVPQQNQQALWSMITGISSIPLVCCCSILGIALGATAIVLGLNAKGEIARSGGMQTGAGMAQAGWICGVVGIALSVLTTVAALMLNTSSFMFTEF